jgi:hypothetical protein
MFARLAVLEHGIRKFVHGNPDKTLIKMENSLLCFILSACVYGADALDTAYLIRAKSSSVWQ